jgi:hypothetical protein
MSHLNCAICRMVGEFIMDLDKTQNVLHYVSSQQARGYAGATAAKAGVAPQFRPMAGPSYRVCLAVLSQSISSEWRAVLVWRSPRVFVLQPPTLAIGANWCANIRCRFPV